MIELIAVDGSIGVVATVGNIEWDLIVAPAKITNISIVLLYETYEKGFTSLKLSHLPSRKDEELKQTLQRSAC